MGMCVIDKCVKEVVFGYDCGFGLWIVVENICECYECLWCCIRLDSVVLFVGVDIVWLEMWMMLFGGCDVEWGVEIFCIWKLVLGGFVVCVFFG